MSRSRKDHDKEPVAEKQKKSKKGTWPRLPVPGLLLFLFSRWSNWVLQRDSLLPPSLCVVKCEEGIKMDRVKRESHNHDTRTLLINFQRSVERRTGTPALAWLRCVWSGRPEDGDNALLGREMARRGGGGQSLSGWRD
ncbi:hypothetical protein QR685DRAFT_448946 [Neurospora intermedia]|uniref:Uncharacterized protein n=1 Tax=Neurospora intermedia TaxID=5142 RepID=A0ABR3D5X1_NEUIN